ncbi:hypothetical protein NDU88_004506 [Pleurodeles waltl]|uniref:Uncharacterized protein n=1 Tax=Pleurodeles waltl TaxID=8319 RepID=A0AAV7RH29_PLEWA|nr:hypothetical protein NDU88_004506 [Pleurodeles waltl]
MECVALLGSTLQTERQLVVQDFMFTSASLIPSVLLSLFLAVPLTGSHPAPFFVLVPALRFLVGGQVCALFIHAHRDQRQRPLETSAIPFAAKSRKIDRLVDMYTAGNTGPSLDDGFHGGSLVELIAVFCFLCLTFNLLLK